jgi:DNA-binding phage protein
MTSRNDLRQVVAQLTELAASRDDMIRALLAAGERPVDLARDAGLSRERIYQIKDRRR